MAFVRADIGDERPAPHGLWVADLEGGEAHEVGEPIPANGWLTPTFTERGAVLFGGWGNSDGGVPARLLPGGEQVPLELSALELLNPSPGCAIVYSPADESGTWLMRLPGH